MSSDTIDDLHAAEDFIHRLSADWVSELLGYLDDNAEWYGDDEESPGPDCDRWRRRLRALRIAAEDYCRPTCRHDEDDGCQGDEPEYCGCPCGHGDYYVLTCDTCGRVGSADDGIEPGGPCQDPCPGVVRVA